jgi:putative endonuclease
MIECSDKTIYVGLTNSIARRIKEHKLGLNMDCYTYSRRPLKLIFHQAFIQFEQAKVFEKRIKKWGRSKKIALAENRFDDLKQLSECKNSSNSKFYKNNLSGRA